jgi:hypothetical protein
MTTTTNRIKHVVERAPHDPTVAYAAVVQASLATMARLMNSFDNEMAFKAASAILEIEKARLRHKEPIAGTEPVQQVEQAQHPEEMHEDQVEQFEKAVDEITVELNKVQVGKGEPEFPREIMLEQYKKKLIEVGFDEFLSWHEWMIGRSEHPPLTTST